MYIISRLFLLLSAGLSFGTGSAAAQEYPTRLITFVIPVSPGGGMDTMARALAPEMSKILGQPIVIENKPGAAFVLAYEYVVKQAPPDGYTLTFATYSGLATLPLLVKDLRFDPLKDLPPIIGLAEGRWVFGSSSKTPWKTFNEFVAYAKANPGKLNYGASGADTRLLSEGLFRDLGIDALSIPYRSGAGYQTALVSGEVHMGFIGENSAVSFGDKFRVLAVTGDQRHGVFRDAPTFSELGYPQIYGLGYAMHGPAGMPRVAFDKLYAAAAMAIQEPGVRARVEKIPLRITVQTPAAAAKRIADDARFFAGIAKKVGIKPE